MRAVAALIVVAAFGCGGKKKAHHDDAAIAAVAPRDAAKIAVADAAPHKPARSEHDWRYFGTITINGETGALAWRAGGYGIGNGTTARELGLWDRIKVEALLMDEPPGFADAPRFPPEAPSVWPKERC